MKPSIQIQGLGKRYYKGHKPSDTLLGSLLGRGSKGSPFWALKDFELKVNPGEVLGLVGANGAGKSTLLKILSRVTHPTAGEFEIRGKMGSLLEVGTGFHPDLTGRENIYLNGTLLGMKRLEVSASLDQIIEFSGVESFLDTPIKHYSSGMKVRLAFSVAAHLRTEILLVDEVLAVGDVSFQEKCLQRMDTIREEEGRTILFVSHNLSAVRSLCSKSCWIDSGGLKALGSTDSILEQYLETQLSRAQHMPLSDRMDRGGDGGVRLTSLSIAQPGGAPLISGKPLQLVVKYSAEAKYVGGKVEFRINVVNAYGTFLTPLSNLLAGTPLVLDGTTGEFICSIDSSPLMDGHYSLDIRVMVDGQLQDQIQTAHSFEVAEGDFYGSGEHYKKGRTGIFVPQNWK